ncbi:hypothetical protein OIU79_019459 [Salix purpurea]|uniref:Uncharacterized protein n=1 Tax=Salix purpurea TaxID=77065 RepID=A0A9Q0SJ61_SALPP|nr:hypothetical protein OIU79_019459 [Salix purpurea]
MADVISQTTALFSFLLRDQHYKAGSMDPRRSHRTQFKSRNSPPSGIQQYHYRIKYSVTVLEQKSRLAIQNSKKARVWGETFLEEMVDFSRRKVDLDSESLSSLLLLIFHRWFETREPSPPYRISRDSKCKAKEDS